MHNLFEGSVPQEIITWMNFAELLTEVNVTNFRLPEQLKEAKITDNGSSLNQIHWNCREHYATHTWAYFLDKFT